MPKYYLSETTLSQIFWNKLYGTSLLDIANKEVALIVNETRLIRESFPKEVAGTISAQSALELWLIARYFGPHQIFEIGTFIGRSTIALLAGAQATLSRFDTCDFSHDSFYLTEALKTHWPFSSRINYWGRTTSAEALAEVMKLGPHPDLLFIDGRVGDADLRLFSHLDRNKTVFVFDDFEGIEKGVENCLAVKKLFPELVMIRPSQHQPGNTGNLAILLPPAIVTITRQQDLPLGLQQ
jgi:predicted O-methyltransferase YrrM